MLEAVGFQIKSASNAAEARSATKDFAPRVAVLDIELGDGPSGIDLAHILRLQFPKIGLIFLTHIPEPRVVGVENRNVPKNAAYLKKDRMADTGVLKAAIEAASRDPVSKRFRDDKTIQYELTNVSRSQLDVLRMVAMGLSNHEIAAQTGTTVRAVEHLVKTSFLSSRSRHRDSRQRQGGCSKAVHYCCGYALRALKLLPGKYQSTNQRSWLTSSFSIPKCTVVEVASLNLG